MQHSALKSNYDFSDEAIDLFAGMDAIPYKFIGKIEGSADATENDLPW